MNEGLLYYDANPSLSLPEKIAQAAIRYRHKYERGWPDTCHVHPDMMGGLNGGLGVKVGDGCMVRVLASPLTQPDHFWIGQKEQES